MKQHGACPFVPRGFPGDYDEDMMDDSDHGVFRSTPIAPINFAAPTSMAERSSDSMEFVTGYTISGREDMNASPVVRKVDFVSIAEEFNNNDTTNVLQRKAKATPMFQHLTASTIRDETVPPQFVSTAQCPTPPLSTMAELTQLDEQTLLNRSETIKMENGAEEDRHSPFGPVVFQEPHTYQYNATKSEKDEMEQTKWSLQEQVFQRYFDLKQREPQWGTLEVRDDNRIFFHPGKRRETVMREKQFHDRSYKDGIKNGEDVAYLKHRHAQYAALVREFQREETKHKQELMLAHLEKNSPFCKFPILADRFLLGRLRGKGGNGEVWDVVDFADQKAQWALKLSVSHKHARREHYTHSRLRHPNIARVGDAAYTIEYRQQLYTAFTVESVDSDLQQLIEMYEFFDELSALNVLYQLLNALVYLHTEMKIAHYDLKPTNILVGRDGCVKLTDFDLARDINEPISSSVVGTLRYLPPECFRPNFGDCHGTAEKADIWMIGVVFCVILWGKHPIIPEKASHDDARRALGGFNGSIAIQRPVSDLSQWIIHGCMHPDPRCRPSAVQVMQALQSAMQARERS